MSKSDEPPVTQGSEMFQERYRLSATVGLDFFSNEAQLPFKSAQAQKNLMAYLYRDALPLVDELILAAESDDVRGLALKLKDVMVNKTEGDK